MKRNWSLEGGWTVLRDGVEIAHLTYSGAPNRYNGFHDVELIGISLEEWNEICNSFPQKLTYRSRGPYPVEGTSEDFTIDCREDTFVILWGVGPRTRWQNFCGALQAAEHYFFDFSDRVFDCFDRAFRWFLIFLWVFTGLGIAYWCLARLLFDN